MVHSFVAYIDESGDEGFKFKPFPERASSEWFVISALMIPRSAEISELKKIDAIIKPIEKERKKVIHFSKLSHEQRIAVCHAIGNTNVRLISICIDKLKLQSDYLKVGYNFYFYYTRYLIERISWLARDRAAGFEGDGRVQLIFSNRNRMSYDDLRKYVDRLRLASDEAGVSIHWASIDTSLIKSRAHADLVGLRAVDSVASGIRYGLELSHYGLCEDAYVELLEPRTYRYANRARSYGMKFFPSVPQIEPERNNRYGWVERLFPR